MKLQAKKPIGGFTLIELLVVIAIISLLSSIVLASLGQARSKARDSKRVQELKQVQTALELYYNANNLYPADPVNVAFRVSAWDATGVAYYDPNKLSVLAPYMNSRPSDPSGPFGAVYEGYWYKASSNRQNYKFVSASVENISSIPFGLVDTNFLSSVTSPTKITMSVSTPGAKCWDIIDPDYICP